MEGEGRKRTGKLGMELREYMEGDDDGRKKRKEQIKGLQVTPN